MHHPFEAPSFTVKVIPFDIRYLSAFVDLNKQWIEKHFAIEPGDLRQLENPSETILAPGGEIFFVLEGARAVGTVAMAPYGEGRYELAKMAVAPDCRGKGFGDLLILSAIEWATKKGAEKIILHSNTILEPAIRLYEKHGFRTTRLGAHPDYQRADIEMEKFLAP